MRTKLHEDKKKVKLWILSFCLLASVVAILVLEYRILQNDRGLEARTTQTNGGTTTVSLQQTSTNTNTPTSTPTPDPTDPREVRRALERKEKEKLEKFVTQEYDDELAGIPSKVAPRNTSSDSLLIGRPLLFLHIPKTAGSTLGQIFKNNVEPNKYYHFWSHPRLNELNILVSAKETYFGHFRYGLHYYLNDSTIYYATMLREPVDRVISYYHFHLQDPEDPAHEFAMTHSFEEWLEQSQAAQNEMTKCLSGIRSEFNPSQKTFEMAKHHLRNMAFVGLTERFEESLVLMKFYFGFTNLKFQSTKVGRKKPEKLSDEVIEKIKQKNEMDIELYKMAKEIFEEQMLSVGDHLLQEEIRKTLVGDGE